MTLDPHTHLWLTSRRVAEAQVSTRSTRRLEDGQTSTRPLLRLLRPLRAQRPCPSC